MDLEDALDRFLQQLRADGRSKHTIAQYRRHVRLLGRWAAGEGLCRDVRDFDHGALARFLASSVALSRPDGGAKKASSTNALRSSIRGFFGYLHRAGYLGEDASRLVRRARSSEVPPRTLSDDDQEALLATLAKAQGEAATRDHALFHLMLGTGIRLGSALALTVEDLDLERGELVLRRSKGGQIQRVFLPEPVRVHLQGYVGERTSGPLFASQSGRPICSRHAQRRLQYWLRQSGARRVSPHALRHTFAMALYRRERDIMLVRRALGHRSLNSTLRYARADDDDLRRAMRAGA